MIFFISAQSQRNLKSPPLNSSYSELKVQSRSPAMSLFEENLLKKGLLALQSPQFFKKAVASPPVFSYSMLIKDSFYFFLSFPAFH